MSGLLKILEQIIRTLFAKNVRFPIETTENKVIVATPGITTFDVKAPDSQDNIPYSNIEFKNNSERLTQEFIDLKSKNSELFNILVDCGNFSEANFKKNVVVTMIYRTQEEQDEIYKDDPKYIEKKFKSPHMFWQAFDLRSSSFEASEIKKIEDYLNNKYNMSNYYGWTSRNHDVGLGFHFHIQFIKK